MVPSAATTIENEKGEKISRIELYIDDVKPTKTSNSPGQRPSCPEPGVAQCP